MATLTVYRGARVCGRIGCEEILDRHGRCSVGHYCGSVYEDDAESIELEVERDRRWPYVAAWFDSKPFTLTPSEVVAASDALDEERNAA